MRRSRTLGGALLAAAVAVPLLAGCPGAPTKKAAPTEKGQTGGEPTRKDGEPVKPPTPEAGN
ncbi:MAG TPA: hypothetical protein VFA26_08195 [Gemmataceae bacterium]|nr:hypothetical protein [Gemmataceae bacterium]